MTAVNFPEAVATTLRFEGGYVDDPHDPGGSTNMGVTIGTLSEYFGRPATVSEVRHLKLDTAQRIYHVNYWNAVRGDDLPSGVDLAVFDFAVNSGVKRAVIGLQRALDIADDGKLGPLTLQATKAADPRVLVRGVMAERFALLRKLSTWPRYQNGWTKRVNGVLKVADAMASHIAIA